MATHSNILTWRIPWTKEPGGLQFMGSQRVRHDWSDLACMHDEKSNHIFEMRLEVAQWELVTKSFSN